MVLYQSELSGRRGDVSELVAQVTKRDLKFSQKDQTPTTTPELNTKPICT
jgi:hypothetical protein